MPSCLLPTEEALEIEQLTQFYCLEWLNRLLSLTIFQHINNSRNYINIFQKSIFL